MVNCDNNSNFKKILIKKHKNCKNNHCAHISIVYLYKKRVETIKLSRCIKLLMRLIVGRIDYLHTMLCFMWNCSKSGQQNKRKNHKDCCFIEMPIGIEKGNLMCINRDLSNHIPASRYENSLDHWLCLWKTNWIETLP